MHLFVETRTIWIACACRHVIWLRKKAHVHSPVNAEPGTAPLHMDATGGLGPIKGPDMHAANQNPATCAATALNLSISRTLLDA